MSWRVERAEAVTLDLEAILDFLIDAALDFGEAPEGAFDSAAARILQIETAIAGLPAAPHQGTRLPDLGPGIRSVTKGRAILYFDLDEERQVLRLLAVFFGGQDHRRRMLLRRLAERES